LSDIFREVEEDVRREKLEKFWKAYGDYVIALAAVIVIGIAGFELWQRYEASQRDKASIAFSAAQRITNPQAAAGAFAEIVKTAPKGYRLLAQLEQASSMLAAGQRETAIALFQEIAEKDNGPTGAVARLREGWARSDTASRADLETLLAPLRVPSNAWKLMADEILAYSDYHNNQIPKAAEEFNALANEPNSPPQLRTRAHAMAAFLKQGGAKDSGTVPPPVAVPAPGSVAAPPVGAPGAPVTP
jgi:hypothetical protein